MLIFMQVITLYLHYMTQSVLYDSKHEHQKELLGKERKGNEITATESRMGDRQGEGREPGELQRLGMNETSVCGSHAETH